MAAATFSWRDRVHTANHCESAWQVSRRSLNPLKHRDATGVITPRRFAMVPDIASPSRSQDRLSNVATIQDSIFRAKEKQPPILASRAEDRIFHQRWQRLNAPTCGSHLRRLSMHVRRFVSKAVHAGALHIESSLADASEMFLTSSFKIQNVTCKLVILEHPLKPKGRVARSLR